jgi:hypothetical protein
MLQHTKWLLEEREEDGSSLIAIHSRFDKLITALRTAVANEYRLDKEQTSYNDLLDTFRLALIFYKRSKKTIRFLFIYRFHTIFKVRFIPFLQITR